jgi:hypothetical protein
MKLKLTKKALLTIGIVIAVGLAIFFFSRGDIDIGGSESVFSENLTSATEASSRLTDVAGDITSFREDIDSLTRGLEAPTE